MLIILSLTLLAFIACILYCILHCTTSYDRMVDDEQQERFINDKK